MIDVELAILVDGPRYVDVRSVVMTELAREYTAALLGQAGGSVAKAARIAGMDRSGFKRLVRRAKNRPKRRKVTPGESTDDSGR